MKSWLLSRQNTLSLLSLFLASCLLLSLCLPWFELPILGWSVPAPAWNKAGLASATLSVFLFLRGVGGWKVRWMVRLALIPAAYCWWTSLVEVKAWGARHLGSAQLEFSSINSTLAKLGVETITIYDASKWRALQPTFGWYAAGLCMLLIALVTSLDGPRRRACSECTLPAQDSDRFCHGCGQTLQSSLGCRNCGAFMQDEDRFCRLCGAEPSVE